MEKYLIICGNLADLAQKAASKFVEIARFAIGEKGLFSVALSGGRTPASLYNLLSEDPYRKQIDWKKVHFFWGDERCVVPDHKESNFLLAKENLLGKLNLPEGNIHRIKGEKGESAAREYEDELKIFFQVSGETSPRFDLILLGLGDDGHTASIFPGTTVLTESDKLVAAVYVHKLKTTRFTFTPRLINAADNIIFLVSGADKSAVLPYVLEGKYQPEKYPAQIVRLAKGEVYWFVDEAAAIRLS